MSALFIILVSLTMTRLSKNASFHYLHGFKSNLIKKSWTDSSLQIKYRVTSSKNSHCTISLNTILFLPILLRFSPETDWKFKQSCRDFRHDFFKIHFTNTKKIVKSVRTLYTNTRTELSWTERMLCVRKQLFGEQCVRITQWRVAWNMRFAGLRPLCTVIKIWQHNLKNKFCF